MKIKRFKIDLYPSHRLIPKFKIANVSEVLDPIENVLRID